MALVGLPLGVEALVCGGFDLSNIRERGPFLARVVLESGLVSGLGALAHLALFRNALLLVFAQAAAAMLLGLLTLAHAVVFGVTLGFPLPAPELIFWPFFSSVQWWVSCHAALATLLAVSLWPAANRGHG